MLRKSKKGFTLLEILVVVAIIGLVASVIIVMLNNARMKARDAKRYAEVDALKKALELHYHNNDEYPEVADWIKIEQDADENGPFSAAMQPYLSSIPRDPLYPKAIGAKVFSYQYKSTADEQGYKLHVEMETGTYVETSYEVYVGEGIILEYIPPPAPTIVSVTPDDGYVTGGTEVIIMGTDFVSGGTITFDGIDATNITWVNDTTITADIPAHEAGAVDVVVANPDTQSSTLTNGFTYTTGISYVRSGGTTGTSFSFNIGSAGAERLVVIIAGDESSGINLSNVTVDGKSCTFITIAENTVTGQNHQEMWYCDEGNLGSSNGSVTIAITGTGVDSSWAIHAHLYTGVYQNGYSDYGIDDTSVNTTVTVTGINVPIDGLVVMGAGEGSGGMSVDSWTSPLIERTNGPDPSSADLMTASAIESSAQTNKTYVATFNGDFNRGTGIVTTWNKTGTPPPAPTVDSVFPDYGPIVGGTTVTIEGNSFVDGATVIFGGTDSPSVIVDSSSQITAITPAHALGVVDVVVRNPDIQSGTLTNGYTYIAIGIDAVSAGSTTDTSITISHTTSGSDRLMLVGVSFNNDSYETVTGVTYNGVVLTLVGTVANSDDSRIEIWRLIAPDIGTHNVVVTFSANLAQEGFAGVVTFTGVDQTTPLGTFSSAENDGTTATVNVSSAIGELVFGVVATEYASSLTVGAGQTEYWKINIDNSFGAGSTEIGAAIVTISWALTGSGDHWAIGGVSIRGQ